MCLYVSVLKLGVYVCVHLCTYANTCMCVCVHIYVCAGAYQCVFIYMPTAEINAKCLPQFLSTVCVETVLFNEQNAHWFSSPGCPSKSPVILWSTLPPLFITYRHWCVPRILSSLYPQFWPYRYSLICSALYMDTRVALKFLCLNGMWLVHWLSSQS